MIRLLLGILCAGVTSLFLVASAAVAEVPPNVLKSMGLPGWASGSAGQIGTLQERLAWIGLYGGKFTAQMDGDTRNALRLFQLGLGQQATGSLRPSQNEILKQRADASLRAADFRSEILEWNGMQIAIPRGFFGVANLSGKENQNLLYSGRDVANSHIDMQRVFGTGTASSWLSELRRWAKTAKNTVLTSGTVNGAVYMVSSSERKHIYSYYEVGRSEMRGIDIYIDSSEVAFMAPVLSRIFKSFSPLKASGVPRNQLKARIAAGTYPGGQEQPDWYRSAIANGSGSVVSFDGHILTNHHVVSGCGRLTVNGSEATLIGSDVRLDLGLVKAQQMAGRDPVRFADRAIGLGERVYVLGYPVFSISPSLNMTSGVVSSTVGYKGDRTRIQVTAPIQPGNSGGPVLSQNGAQVAVVASKPTSVTQADKNIENIGWVIRGNVAADFMRRFDVEPVQTTDAFLPPRGDFSPHVREWRRYTVRVECHNY